MELERTKYAGVTFFWHKGTKYPKLGNIEIVHYFRKPIDNKKAVSRDYMVIWIGMRWLTIPYFIGWILIKLTRLINRWIAQ